jgi:hypothetical protein
VGGLSLVGAQATRLGEDCSETIGPPYCCCMPTEKRQGSRVNVLKRVQVSYVDQEGRDRFEIVQLHDVSASGCRILLHFRCPHRALVSLRLSPAHSGSATIRYQNPTPRGYTTGLEFLGGLRLPFPDQD